MGKTFAVVVAVIALVSTGIFISHHWWFPEVASAHGAGDEPSIRGNLYWRRHWFRPGDNLGSPPLSGSSVTRRATSVRSASSPAAPSRLLILAFVYVGLEIVLLEVVGQKVWAAMYFIPAAGRFAEGAGAGRTVRFLLPLSRSGRKVWARCMSTRSTKGRENFFGIDPADPASKDDIVTAELGEFRSINRWNSC